MKDGRGVDRLDCSVPNCPCRQFTTSGSSLNKCINCTHPPTRHTRNPSPQATEHGIQRSQEMHTMPLKVSATDEDDCGEKCDEEFCIDEGKVYVGESGSDEGEEYMSTGDGEWCDSSNVECRDMATHPLTVGRISGPAASLLSGGMVGEGTSLAPSNLFSAPPCKFPGYSWLRYPMPPAGNGTGASGSYDFCSRQHGQKFAKLQQRASMKPAVNSLVVSSREKCKIPSCSKKRFLLKGVLEDFCGGTCADRAKRESVSPEMLFVVPFDSNEFKAVSKKIITAWRKGAALSKSSIKAILYIDCSKLNKHYSRYIETNLRGQANEVEYFHGTTLRCDLAGTAEACKQGSCGACGISASGFSASKIGSHVKFQRLGKAFYTAPNSSKSHEYTEGHAGCRALVLCSVARGKVYEATKDMQSLSQPPEGYNSVAATPGKHNGMNYGEVATYDSGSILPKYIILYQHDGIRLLL